MAKIKRIGPMMSIMLAVTLICSDCRSEDTHAAPGFSTSGIERSAMRIAQARHLLAENSDRAPRMISIPKSLDYLFDLPWCRAWAFDCSSGCTKKGSKTTCNLVNRDKRCIETFAFPFCQKFNIPGNCLSWSDGCNSCERDGSEFRSNLSKLYSSLLGNDNYYCTAAACPHYKPAFTCTMVKRTGASNGK